MKRTEVFAKYKQQKKKIKKKLKIEQGKALEALGESAPAKEVRLNIS